jgi:PPOX class probable F420-dependent enzyme
MRRMDEAEMLEFLSHGTRTGKLATVRADGRPHVAPIWFVVDGDSVVFNTGAGTVKAANLRREGRAALTVDLEEPPFSYVTIEGKVSISEDLVEMLDFATRIGGRYMGAARAEEFGRRNAVDGELLVRLRMDKVISAADMSD